MKRLLSYLGLLVFFAGGSLFVTSAKPPNSLDNARKAAAALEKMNATRDVEEAGRLRLEAAGHIGDTLQWKQTRRDAGFALMGLGTVLLAAYASVRRVGATASRLSPALAAIALLAFASGLFLFARNFTAPAGFAVAAARSFNEIASARAEYGGAARAEELARQHERAQEAQADEREALRSSGVALLALGAAAFVAHLRLSRPKPPAVPGASEAAPSASSSPPPEEPGADPPSPSTGAERGGP